MTTIRVAGLWFADRSPGSFQLTPLGRTPGEVEVRDSDVLTFRSTKDASQRSLVSLASEPVAYQVYHLELVRQQLLRGGPELWGPLARACPLETMTLHLVSPLDFAGIEALTSLRDLSIGRQTLLAEAGRHLGALSSLDRLVLQQLTLEYEFVQALVKSRSQLRKLSLLSCQLSGDAVEALAYLPSLKELALFCRGVEPDSVRAVIAAAPHLQLLGIRRDIQEATSLEREISASCPGLKISWFGESPSREKADS